MCAGYAYDPRKLGAVKLNKVLWLADFRAYLHFGKPITGVRYIKRRVWPVPKPILPVLRELEEDGILSIRKHLFWSPQRSSSFSSQQTTIF